MTTIKERPVLFNGQMVRAILSGQKTVTRRFVPAWQLPSKTRDDERWISIAQRHPRWGFGVFGDTEEECMGNYSPEYRICCPFGAPRERLWVRETYGDAGCRLTYRADLDDGAHCMVKKWTPSIHMPRRACRILLDITSARVERLQDISEESAIAEGVTHESVEAYRRTGVDRPAGFAFRDLWQSVYGEESWTANPWVWVVEFKRVMP